MFPTARVRIRENNNNVNNNVNNNNDNNNNTNNNEAEAQQNGDMELDAEEEEVAGPDATLSTTPRNVYLLWQEYTHGIGGRKAAKDFTPAERGREKCKYSRRKIVWDVINTMIRAGFTSQAAVDKIYEVYGQRSTTSSIIERMRADRIRHGVHPDLLPPGIRMFMATGGQNRGNRNGR
jgi:hypothetical protein